jgi:hypothetical protein
LAYRRVTAYLCTEFTDEADAGGTKQTMAQLNQWSNSKSAFYGMNISQDLLPEDFFTYVLIIGYYAQAPCGKTFDGSQLNAVKSDVVASGAIFQPAVMPTGVSSLSGNR